MEKYNYKYVKEEQIEGKDYYVIERDPVDRKSGYSKQIVWYDKEKYIPVKIEYFDRKGDLLKTLTYSMYNQYLNKYWRADEMLMNNHQTGKSTRLQWRKYQFANGLTKRDFDKNSLKRAR